MERKLQEVVVARYSWRHEAEFAAGFLDDAGIPYRLQIDDPSLGISVSAAATLWVRAADETRAREVLDINEQHAPRLSKPRSRNHPEPPRPTRPPSAGPGAVTAGEYAPTRLEHGRESTTLTLRARALSVLGAIGLVGAGQGILAHLSVPGLDVAATVGAALLVIVGVVGWAPRVLRDLLRALSGSAP